MIPTNELITKVRTRNIKTILTNVFLASGGGGATAFLGLTDTPSTYVGQSLKGVRVNAGETALEFATASGSGDVTGPASAVADDIATFNGVTGKIIKDGSAKISDLQLRTEKDASAGYVGLTLFKINWKNAANTFTSFFTNINTAARTYTGMDRDGTIADTWINKAIGSTLDRRHCASENGTANSTAALTINVLRSHSFEIKSPTTIDRLTCEVTIGSTGNVVIGIYTSGTNGAPDQKVIDSGQIAISGTGAKDIPIASTLLLPGTYWFAYLTDTANTFRCFTSVASLLTTGGFPNTLGATVANAWSVALTYATSMPQTYTAGGAFTTISVPCIGYRAI